MCRVWDVSDAVLATWTLLEAILEDHGRPIDAGAGDDSRPTAVARVERYRGFARKAGVGK